MRKTKAPMNIDGAYRLITPIFKKYGNLPLCLTNYALFSLPPIFTKNIYTYTLSNIIYLGKPLGNIFSNYHGTFIHIFMHGYYPILNIYILNRLSSVNVTVLFADVSSFLPMLLLKLVHFLQVGFLLELISLKFMSYCIPQDNLLQHFIFFPIRKIQVQKLKLSLISFHLYGMMITF